MEIIKGLENIREKEDSVITLGTFDGLHLGHKKIIDTVVEAAHNKNKQSILVTFEPHPRLVLTDSVKTIRLLSTIDEKIEFLHSFRVDVVVIVNFNKEFANKSYRDFVKNILLEKLALTHLVLGYDHHFGKDREGNFDSLKDLAEQYNFSIEKVNPLYLENKLVSSSLIRQYLSEGQVSHAALFLDRPYQLKGTVVKGEGRGKLLTFPTANLKLHDSYKIIPMNGVYAVDIDLKEQRYKGMMNIGTRPTFDNNNYTLEVHVLGLNENIYNENLTVYFKKRLRAEKKFSSKEELINQLKIDKENSLHL
jgi:riboflavin kinase / FMN adenylyltransferase